MADGGAPPSTAALYGGGVGKLRKVKKAPAKPYDRPPPQRGWISSILSRGANLIPSLFSSSSSTEEVQPEVEHATEDLNENVAVNTNAMQLLSPASIGVVGPSAAEENLRPDMSYEAGVDKRREHSDGGLPDIEQMIKGKTFSRKEIDHLMEILRSRVDAEQEVKAPSFTGTDEVERKQTSNGKQKASVIESEERDRFQVASTPLQKPPLQGEVGASPIDIARAYMGSRTSEVGLTSPSMTLKNEKWTTTGEFMSKPMMPSPVPRAPICWPGAVTQSQQGYSTPQNKKSGYGLQSFPRTPYSRTMYTKSKSKLNPLRGDSERLSNMLSTPLQAKESPGYGKSISSAAQDSYVSGGPIRRTRNKFTSAAPVKESPLARSIHRSPFSKDFNTSSMTKNNFEHGTLSTTNFEPSNRKLQNSEVGIPSAHPHSSKLARQILEHIDRPVTLKETSKELKLAASSKNTHTGALDPPVEDISNPGNGIRKSVDLFSTKPYSQSNGVIHGSTIEKTDITNNHTGKDVCGSKVNLDKTSVVSDGNVDSAPDRQKFDSGTRNQEQAIKNNILKTNIFPDSESKGVEITFNSTKFEPMSAQRKPFLPSIAVGKSGLRNSFSSDTSVGFSFPVTTSSNTYFDLPTPTVMPSSLTSSPQKSPPDGKITIAPPVFSLPPTSTASILSDDVPPKFQFGSEKVRLSFALQEDDVFSSSDALNINYKFGSGKNRLYFGSIAASAAGC